MPTVRRRRACPCESGGTHRTRVRHVAGPNGQEPAPAKAGELRLAGISSIAAANAWLAGFIAIYNTRFGREPANPKNLHRPPAQADNLDEILAWREERTVTRNLTLHYDRMMLILDPTPLTRGLVRQKVEVVNYPDGRFAVQCVTEMPPAKPATIAPWLGWVFEGSGDLPRCLRRGRLGNRRVAGAGQFRSAPGPSE